MGLRCKRCGGGEQVKNGLMRGKQRYRCKACGLNFTATPPRGMPLRLKVEAVLLYVSGLSMNRTAKLLGVSTPTVMAWIERFAEVYAQKPEPEGRAVVVELDAQVHRLCWSVDGDHLQTGDTLGVTNLSAGELAEHFHFVSVCSHFDFGFGSLRHADDNQVVFDFCGKERNKDAAKKNEKPCR